MRNRLGGRSFFNSQPPGIFFVAILVQDSRRLFKLFSQSCERVASRRIASAYSGEAGASFISKIHSDFKKSSSSELNSAEPSPATAGILSLNQTPGTRDILSRVCFSSACAG